MKKGWGGEKEEDIIKLQKTTQRKQWYEARRDGMKNKCQVRIENMREDGHLERVALALARDRAVIDAAASR